MTEPETFDDDLFADLYNDDEPSKAPPAPAQHDPAPAPVPAPAPAQSHADIAADDGAYQPEYDDGDAQMNNDELEDDDDEVDFNLGNGTTTMSHQVEEPSSYGTPPAPVSQQQHKGPNSKEDGKMFIGGLNWETTDQSLRDYFSQFGDVTECTVMRDGATGRSRGFGFLTFKDPKTVNIVMVKEHYLDGKIIDPKRAIPRDEQEKTSKIFVGGVSQEVSDQEFREYFAQFGRVVDATLMMDKDTGRPRGFGFVTFENDAAVEACLATHLEIKGKMIEVKRAQPRGNLREEEEAARRGGGGGGAGGGNKFGRNSKGTPGSGGSMDDQGSANNNSNNNNSNNNAAMAAMAGGAQGGMTPQLMAQYWQRMQQYFAMMQNQMAMNRGMGMGMNPQMMQMMQMQQMMAAQQGRGGGNNPMAAMAMNPQMMQQMQQMMNQQQGGGNGDGGSGQPGYNAFEQQQFEQQKYDPQGGQRRGGGGGGGAQGGYNNQAYNNNMGGGPTSWEGMYDDVPQPMVQGGGGGGARGGFHKRGGGGFQQQQQQQQQAQGPIDPTNAPPANAPTGPKNAGRPGANYRGGGRGSSRGFHPYARN